MVYLKHWSEFHTQAIELYSKNPDRVSSPVARRRDTSAASRQNLADDDLGVPLLAADRHVT
jgi:hypothetical protein